MDCQVKTVQIDGNCRFSTLANSTTKSEVQIPNQRPGHKQSQHPGLPTSPTADLYLQQALCICRTHNWLCTVKWVWFKLAANYAEPFYAQIAQMKLKFKLRLQIWDSGPNYLYTGTTETDATPETIWQHTVKRTWFNATSTTDWWSNSLDVYIQIQVPDTGDKARR